MRVLICGGGVIGASLAYFLSRRGVQVVVIERTGVACAASGKSGGFLALDWCDGSPLEHLARRSFALSTKAWLTSLAAIGATAAWILTLDRGAVGLRAPRIHPNGSGLRCT